jgi:hypothetical protein
MGLSKARKRQMQHDYERRELHALRVLCDEQQQQIADLRALVRWLRRRIESSVSVDAVDPVDGVVEGRPRA